MKIENENYTIWTISDENGKVSSKVYQVFQGIQLIFTEAHMQSYTFGDNEKWSDDVFEITYCKEGRIECGINDEFCYLEAGDLAIAHSNGISRESYFSLCHFHGVSIRIDARLVSNSLSHILEDLEVAPDELMKKFCRNKNGFIVRSFSSVERIFEELYSGSHKFQKGYMKIKVLELLLFLSVFEIEEKKIDTRTYSNTQVVLAKKVAEYLMKHMDKRITLEQLAKQFHISGSHLKNIFKAVYGVSYYSYVRAQKMQSAAYMLEYTDKSILQIAGEHGYDNGSKFANAFRSVIGMNPNAYRNKKKSI